MASVHEAWTAYLSAHHVTTDIAAFNLVHLASNKEVKRTSYGTWYANPKTGAPRVKDLIERTVTQIINGSNPTAVPVQPTITIVAVPTLNAAEMEVSTAACSPLQTVAVPDDGWAKADWRQDLRILCRESRVHTKMVELLRSSKRDENRKITFAHVYIMRDPAKEGVKVGVAVDVKKRMKDFRAAVPNIELVSSFTTMDAYGVERLVHAFGRIAETKNLYPTKPNNEYVFLTPNEAAICILTAKMVVEDGLEARLRRAPSKDPEERASVPPE